MVRRVMLSVLLVVAASACRDADAESTASDEGAVINGSVAEPGSFGSVVRIDEACTATQIAPRLLVTASHCMRLPQGAVSPSFAPGRELSVESRASDGTLRMTKIAIVSAAIHPRLTEVCAAENGGAGCKGSSASAARDAPDIGVIKLAGDIPNATVTPISTSPSKVGESLVPAGFGCVEKLSGPTDDKLRIGSTPVIDSADVAHPGSGLTAAETEALSGVYVFTEGPALHGNKVSALCPGDSGGPIFRHTPKGFVLVGINSSYTFPVGNASVPATNWHSRVDVFARYETFIFLENAGSTYAP